MSEHPKSNKGGDQKREVYGEMNQKNHLKKPTDAKLFDLIFFGSRPR